MARAARVSRGGPGYFGLIFFIVLSLLLIGGYVWLVPAYARRGSEMNNLQNAIKQNLEDPLHDSLGVSASAQPSPSVAAYDASFFDKIGKSALLGVKYDELRTKTGYAGENPVAEINQLLGSVQPPAENLRKYIDKLNIDATVVREALNQANTALAAATSARETAIRLQSEAEEREKKAQAEKQQLQSSLEKKHREELEQVKALWTKADQETKKAYAQAKARDDEFRKQMGDVQAELKKTETQVLELKEELARKKPKLIPVLEGRVLQADMVEGFVIISLGKRENIDLGEKFTVVRQGKANERLEVGEIQIVRVDPLTCRGDVTQKESGATIMRGDIVVRQKKTVEVEDEK